jgi:hypothetical protein
VTLAFLRSGRIVGQATTNSGGRYRVALAPGRYFVRLVIRDRAAFGLVPTPARARVAAHRFRRVDFSYDTGIR